ncbi:helix-turn-helix domain-containing protein [Aequorivita marina]|uniref:helix-turn-helix domain-containing protein n=1 Tax=Aequorivita marina TaxID=3073654 RepID=UPI002874A234|nr:helix-turn-helix domain-containing protein [Aequorivita sp. S2608]MDS1299258.1 helix-turn-helix domain-containing protein [Aequorivita sp. S2608]
MRLLFLVLLVLCTPWAILSQENIPINELLNEADAKLYNQPEQAGKIALYIISQKEPTTIHAKATLLLAQSYYVQGNYTDAVKNALKARKFADSATDIDIKYETILFALKLFRNIGLETVADKYRDNLVSLQSQLHDTKKILLLNGKLKQDSASVLFQKEEYAQALTLLSSAEPLFLKINDSSSLRESKLIRAAVLTESGALATASKQLEALQPEVNTDFEKAQVLDILGNLHFKNNAYKKAVNAYQKALALSLKLPNKHYQNTSLEGLTVSYLALEDTQNFFTYKQQSNLVASEIETDKSLAINAVYNFINSYQAEVSEKKLNQSYFYLYIIGGILLLLMVIGWFINYLYTSKRKEYEAIYKYISPQETASKPQTTRKTLEKSSIVPEETEQLLLQKLNKFESGTKYTNADMSIALLASQFDTNTKYLSEVINRQKGKNFNSYINELRINYIIEKLKTDPVYFNYKVSYLAQESGFSSHSSFATVFKSVTGVSPTKFMSFLQQKQEVA